MEAAGASAFVLNAVSNLTNATNTSNALAEFSRATPAKVWGIGLLFVTLISCCAAVGIALMPCLTKRTYDLVLTYFVGLGVGSLSGSAIFHLLPQAFDLVDKEEIGHSYLGKCWVAVIGIFLFYLVDKVLKIVFELRKQRKLRRQGVTNHVDQNRSYLVGDGTTSPTLTTPNSAKCFSLASTEEQEFKCADGCNDPSCVQKENFKVNLDCGHGGHQIITTSDGRHNVIATVAWMIIFGDGLHNFIDGLSIGTAFSVNILSGISISVAVLCEEFPHELGDVAILLASGMTMRQALVYNLMSAATCYIGFFIGVLVGELDEASFYIFALAAGCFLYISLGNMIAEMNKEMDRALDISLNKGSLILALHSTGIFTGLLTMFLMAFYGSEISFD